MEELEKKLDILIDCFDADLTAQNPDDDLYEAIKEKLINQLLELFKEEREKEIKSIASVFEINILMDEKEDGKDWYENLKTKMRKVLSDKLNHTDRKDKGGK